MRPILSGVLIAALTIPQPVPASQQAVPTTLIVVEGKDTTSIEQFHRSGNIIVGIAIDHRDRTVLHEFTLTLGRDGMPLHFDMSVDFADGKGNFPTSGIHYTLDFAPDGATLVSRANNGNPQRVDIKGGAFPAFGTMMGTDLGMVQIRAAHAKSGSIAFTDLGMNKAAPARIVPVMFIGTDSAIVGTERVRTDVDGHLVAWRAEGGGEGRRVAPFDVRKVAAAWAGARPPVDFAGDLSSSQFQLAGRQLPAWPCHGSS